MGVSFERGETVLRLGTALFDPYLSPPMVGIRIPTDQSRELDCCIYILSSRLGYKGADEVCAKHASPRGSVREPPQWDESINSHSSQFQPHCM